MNDTPTTEIYTSGHTLSLPDSLPISTDPQLSQQIANAVAQTYIEDQVRLKNDVVADANSFLGSRMDELRAEVEAAERKVEAFRGTTPIISDDDGTLHLVRTPEGAMLDRKSTRLNSSH